MTIPTTISRRFGLLLAGVSALAAACHHGGGSGEGEGGGGSAVACTAPAPGGRLLRRLSRGEYDATVHDLLGVDSAYGAAFTADTVVNGFDNNAAALVVSPLLADQARKAAEALADAVLKSPGNVIPCAVATGDAACAAKLVDTLGKRAFRRPLTAAERARYLALYDGVAAADGFAEGAKTVISALLQSPNFLYRTEIGDGTPGRGEDTVQLTPYEIASELSYFLWGSMPDDALFAAAESGALASPDAIEKQARRMLDDPRSDATLRRFVDQWLEIDRLPTFPTDPVTYPELTPAVRTAMLEETHRFVQHAMREGSGALPELLLGAYTFADPDLATFYGLPAPAGDGFAEIDLSGTPRAGLLTQGSVLTTHARPNSSSPIHRGKLVRERLFCQNMPPPPSGIVVQPPPLDPTLTTRERYAAHATQQPCKGCHQLMDPIGFGFEHFDGIGRWRDDENGRSIDATGTILATTHTNGDFDGVEDLAGALADSPDVKACFARQWFRFAYGVKDDADLACLAGQVGEGFAGGDLRVADLVVALTRTPHFTERTRDGSEGNPGSGGAGGAGGGASSSSTSASSSSSGGGGPMGSPGIDVTTAIDSQWMTGYQESVTVTNHGTAPVTWSVTIPVDGPIANVWNAKVQTAGAQTTFVGVDYDAVVAPGMSVSFGFVVNK